MTEYQVKTSDRVLLWATRAAAAGACGALVVAASKGGLDGVVAQVFLTFVCLFCGAIVMRLQVWGWLVAGGRRRSTLRTLGVAAVFVSQASFLILVWSNWRAWAVLWRFWWVSAVPAVLVAHLLLIRAAGEGRWGPVERANALVASVASLMVLYLGLRADVFARTGFAFRLTLVMFAGASGVLSAYLGVRQALRKGIKWRMSRRAFWGWVASSYAVVAVGSFYLGRATAARTADMSTPLADVVKAVPDDLADQFGKDAYNVQSKVAEYLGDTRVLEREPYITEAQIDAAEAQMKPGDIILERRNWYLSNPWLPGFWPHAALYVGGIEDLERLGIADHPSVTPHLDQYLSLAADGRRHTVIEAVSEGVLMNSLVHSMHADYVAVLRPRVTNAEIATAIARAFENLGKQYDFNFDFDDRDKLVCTQVVYLSYEGAVTFELKRVMGRNTLPALEIARTYVTERSASDRQMDFVLFLDAEPEKGTAREATEEEFCASVDRPRVLVER